MHLWTSHRFHALPNMGIDAMVKLEKMKFHSFHGCLPEERRDGNTFYVTLEYDYDMKPAAESDDLSLAIDYSVIYKIVARQMEHPSLLLENVALRIAGAVKEAFPRICKGRVTVVKMNPPLGGPCENSSVTMDF